MNNNLNEIIEAVQSHHYKTMKTQELKMFYRYLIKVNHANSSVVSKYRTASPGSPPISEAIKSLEVEIAERKKSQWDKIKFFVGLAVLIPGLYLTTRKVLDTIEPKPSSKEPIPKTLIDKSSSNNPPEKVSNQRVDLTVKTPVD